MGRGDVVGSLPVVYDPTRQQIVVENSAEFVKTQIRQKLDDLAHGSPLRLTLTVERQRKKRSLEQNRMMWALLTVMADHYNGGRTGGRPRLAGKPPWPLPFGRFAHPPPEGRSPARRVPASVRGERSTMFMQHVLLGGRRAATDDTGV